MSSETPIAKAPAGFEHDDAARLEDAKGVSHGATADAVELGDLLLADPLAILVLAAQDRHAEMVRDLLWDRARPA